MGQSRWFLTVPSTRSVITHPSLFVRACILAQARWPQALQQLVRLHQRVYKLSMSLYDLFDRSKETLWQSYPTYSLSNPAGSTGISGLFACQCWYCSYTDPYFHNLEVASNMTDPRVGPVGPCYRSLKILAFQLSRKNLKLSTRKEGRYGCWQC